MQVNAILDGHLLALGPVTKHFSPIFEFQQTLPMLHTILEPSDVLTTIREDESAVSMHLFFLEFSNVNTVAFIRFFSRSTSLLDIFATFFSFCILLDCRQFPWGKVLR